MRIENAKAQMRKGVLEYCILSVLSGNDAYTSDVIKELKEAEIIVVEGTLYPLLTRLKNDALLSYRWEESTQGPPRKYYRLTEEGILFLKELDCAWSELVLAVRRITDKSGTTDKNKTL
ncbi:MAG: PadR family transcriptional regulator [Bacteroidetes bacterium]|nr:PadR family transcriptional regulator [Bacteroidota bacterium]